MRGAVAIAAVVALAVPAAASARVPKRFGGVIPDRAAPSRTAPRATADNLPYEGGRVLHSNRTHLIFWAPSGSGLGFEPGYEALIETFLADVAADSHKFTNVYSLSGQYHDAGGPAAYDSTYGGAVVDTDPLPPNGCSEPPGPPLGDGPGWRRCMSDEQLEAEIEHVVAVDRLPQTDRDVYFLVMPDGLGSCEFSGPDDCALGGSPSGYCGYHSTTGDGLPYAVIPYNAVGDHCQSRNPRPNSSPADPSISTVSHEHNEMVTDPLDDAWIDSSFEEDGDLCLDRFGPVLGGSGAGAFNEVIDGHHYFLQEEWSNDDSSCQPRDEPDRVTWSTVPARPRAGARIRFVAHGSDPDGTIVSYEWSFRARGRRVTRSFGRAGRYRVTLRSTDSDGNWAFSTRTIRVRR